jgi:transposase
VGVPFNFVACDRDQLLLMPPSLADWLPEDHLAWFVIDAVDQLDLSGFYASYRLDGWGAAAHHPQMMVSLLVYAYCNDVTSSRRVERACQTDVAFRVITANQQPDHTTIARFRRRHAEALKGLFAQTLRLCAEAGLVKVGLVALDGTKIAASASIDSNRSRPFIEEIVEEMFAQAEAADQADEAAGDDDDVGPGVMRGRVARRERFRQAKAVLDEREAAERAVFDAKTVDRQQREDAVVAATGKRMNGRKLKPFAPDLDVRVNVTDAASRVMKSKKVFLQGYNPQAIATCEQIVIAAEVTNQAADVHQLQPMIAAAKDTLEAAGVTDEIGVVVADAGYVSDANLTSDCGVELLIATRNRRKMKPDEQRAPRGPIPKSATPRERMDRKLATKRGQRLYRQRSAMIEPVFGQIKHNRGHRTFLLRGLDGADLEWKLICTTHNLLKLFRMSHS